ncbi:hypothetical protein AB0I27_06810 [Streptomyces sp. NPDC050597]
MERRKSSTNRKASKPQQLGRAVLAGVISKALWALLVTLFGGDDVS